MGEVGGAEAAAPTGCLHRARRARRQLAVAPRTPVPVWTLKAVDSGPAAKPLGLLGAGGGLLGLPLRSALHHPGVTTRLGRCPPRSQPAASFSTQRAWAALLPHRDGGGGEPALMECLLNTTGPPLSTALILRLPVRRPRRLTGGGDVSERPSRDGARARATLAVCSLPGACRRLLAS